ncbi:MAG: DNA polymerase I [Deltaproteobacteria bacterium]|nr:DNA polymerase I [Deltaproteobacteria bacterium]
MGYVFRAFHALPPLTDPGGRPVGAVYGFTQMLAKLVREQAPAYLACAMEGKGKTEREERFAEYKATRPPPPEDLVGQIERVQEVIAAYAIPALSYDGCEADDVIATLTRRARSAGLTVVIVSSDKDLMSLVGEGVVMLDTLRNTVYDSATVEERWGVPPRQVPEVLALMGDASDNVPGVAGIGPKTAAELIRTFGTVEEAIARAGEIKKQKLRETLQANAEVARLSRWLVTLREDLDLPFDLGSLRYGGWDADRLRDLFRRLGFRRLLQELDGAGSAGEAPPAAPAQSTATAAPQKVEATTVRTREALAAVVAACRAAGRFAIEAHPAGRAQEGADLFGVALAWSPSSAAYVPLTRSLLESSEIGAEDLRSALAPLLSDPSLKKLVHDLKRTSLVLSGWGIGPGVAFDTMLGSYLMDPERHGHRLDQIASSDLGPDHPAADSGERGRKVADEERTVLLSACWRAAAIFAAAGRLTDGVSAQGLSAVLSEIELPLAYVLADLERAGVEVDTAELARLSASASEELVVLEREARALAGVDFNVSSPKQLAEVLFDKLGLPIGRKTKTGYSTDSDVLEELEPLHPLPGKILEHRAIAKLKGTYLDALPRMVNPRTGRVHTSYNQTGSATGRISSNDPNLQNIPVRTELGRRIRRAFVARPGTSLLSADYSQIELRVLAHLSGDAVLLDSFARGEDVHDRTAREVFGARGEVGSETRRRAKAINFGVIYGQTDFGLARSLGIGRAEAKAFIAAYFRTYAGVAAFLERTVAEARSRGFVTTAVGRRRFLPLLRSSNHNVRMAAERVARNTPVQGTAADVLKIAMVRVHGEIEKRGLGTRMLLTVHDELIFEVPSGEEEVATAVVREQMARAMDLEAALEVDVGVGPNWEACKR